jgi:hypothetical protein
MNDREKSQLEKALQEEVKDMSWQDRLEYLEIFAHTIADGIYDSPIVDEQKVKQHPYTEVEE